MGFGSTSVIQVTNVAPTVTNEQIRTLFTILGTIREFIVYPQNDPSQQTARVSYVRFADPVNVCVAQHLNNTVFIDRPIVVKPFNDNKIPDETLALKLANEGHSQNSSNNGVVSQIETVNGVQSITTIDPRLNALGLPQYPPLPSNLDPSKIEEIRRTVIVSNVNKQTTPEDLVKFFGQFGEVKFLRMITEETELIKSAMIEYTDQSSVANALQNTGTTLHGSQITISHSSTSILKPQFKLNAKLEKIYNRDLRRRSRSRSYHRSRSPSTRSSRRRRSRTPRRSRDRDRKRSLSGSRSPRRRRSRSYERNISPYRRRSRDRSYSKERHRRERSKERTRRRSSRERSVERRRYRDERDRDRRRRDRSRERDYDRVRYRSKERSRRRDRSRSRESERKDKHRKHKVDSERRRSRSISETKLKIMKSPIIHDRKEEEPNIDINDFDFSNIENNNCKPMSPSISDMENTSMKSEENSVASRKSFSPLQMNSDSFKHDSGDDQRPSSFRSKQSKKSNSSGNDRMFVDDCSDDDKY